MGIRAPTEMRPAAGKKNPPLSPAAVARRLFVVATADSTNAGSTIIFISGVDARGAAARGGGETRSRESSERGAQASRDRGLVRRGRRLGHGLVRRGRVHAHGSGPALSAVDMTVWPSPRPRPPWTWPRPLWTRPLSRPRWPWRGQVLGRPGPDRRPRREIQGTTGQ